MKGIWLGPFARSTAVIGALLLGACEGPHGNPVRVIVPRGASFRTAADSMAAAGVITSPLAFRVYARLKGRDRQIQAGTYLLRRGTRWSDLVGEMNGGVGILNRVTIPEGFTIAQITPVLVRALNTTSDSVEAAVRDSALRMRLADPAETLEGY